MQLGRLHIYQAPVSKSGTTQPFTSPAGTVSISLEEVLPILADAYAHNRAWLQDFGDEPMTISQDLYDVLMAYERYTRSAED
jgi:hypothetical protein